MEQDDPAEAVTELRERRLGALELLQAATGSGLAAYAVWARLLQPGFRRVPLRLQVPYLGASARQVENVLSLMRGRRGNMVDLGSGDGRIVQSPPGCGLRAEPVPGGAGTATRVEGRLFRERLLPL